MSVMAEEIVSSLASCMRGNFVDVARGDQLDRVAFDRYGLTRFSATPSTVVITMTRPSVGSPGTYPAGSRVQTPAGVQVATDIDAVFGPTDLTASIPCTAIIAGPGGNVSAAALTQFKDVPFDTAFTVTNADGAAGGNDAESDVQFRGRIRNFFPTVRRGVLGAIQFGAMQVPGVAVATAFEATNTLGGPVPIPAGMVQVIVADESGSASAPMLQAVRDALIEYRAGGIPAQVLGGSLAPFPAVTWSIDFTTGVDTVLVSEQVRAVCVASAQFLAPGETLYRSSLIAAAKTIPGAIVNDTSLVAPVGDVVPTSIDLVIRVRPQDVTFV